MIVLSATPCARVELGTPDVLTLTAIGGTWMKKHLEHVEISNKEWTNIDMYHGESEDSKLRHSRSFSFSLMTLIGPAYSTRCSGFANGTAQHPNYLLTCNCGRQIDPVFRSPTERQLDVQNASYAGCSFRNKNNGILSYIKPSLQQLVNYMLQPEYKQLLIAFIFIVFIKI